MAQGCAGNTPEPIACCPLNSFGNAVDPNPATETCGAGYEPGSIWENSTDGSFWIMTACPDTWQCISGCESELYHMRIEKNDNAYLQTFDSLVSTPVWFGVIGVGAPVYEYPAGLTQWQVGSSGEYDTWQVPYNGIYSINVSFTLNLKDTTLVGTSDFVVRLMVGGVTEIDRAGKEVYNTVGNEFLYMDSGKSFVAEFTAGQNVTIELIHDSGVSCGVGSCNCGVPAKDACIRTVNATAQSPAFNPPQAGVLTIDQIA